jgi:hypothetical protein
MLDVHQMTARTEKILMKFLLLHIMCAFLHQTCGGVAFNHTISHLAACATIAFLIKQLAISRLLHKKIIIQVLKS